VASPTVKVFARDRGGALGSFQVVGAVVGYECPEVLYTLR
jgi:hypothetical protein